MRVKIIRAIDDQVLNIRYTDEIAEDQNWTDAEMYRAEDELKKVGRYWIDADTLLLVA